MGRSTEINRQARTGGYRGAEITLCLFTLHKWYPPAALVISAFYPSPPSCELPASSFALWHIPQGFLEPSWPHWTSPYSQTCVGYEGTLISKLWLVWFFYKSHLAQISWPRVYVLTFTMLGVIVSRRITNVSPNHVYDLNPTQQRYTAKQVTWWST